MVVALLSLLSWLKLTARELVLALMRVGLAPVGVGLASASPLSLMMRATPRDGRRAVEVGLVLLPSLPLLRLITRRVGHGLEGVGLRLGPRQVRPTCLGRCGRRPLPYAATTCEPRPSVPGSARSHSPSTPQHGRPWASRPSTWSYGRVPEESSC